MAVSLRDRVLRDHARETLAVRTITCECGLRFSQQGDRMTWYWASEPMAPPTGSQFNWCPSCRRMLPA